MITVEVKATGRRAGLVPSFGVPLPPEVSPGDALRLRDLIAVAVRGEVAAAAERRAERTLAQVLTERDLARGAQTGAFTSGERHAPALPPVEHAVGVALEAFADGLFLVLVDGVQQHELDALVTVGPDSTLTFVRLVALAGG